MISWTRIQRKWRHLCPNARSLAWLLLMDEMCELTAQLGMIRRTMIQTGSVSWSISWSPSYGYLHRSMMASTRLCKTSLKCGKANSLPCLTRKYRCTLQYRTGGIGSRINNYFGRARSDLVNYCLLLHIANGITRFVSPLLSERFHRYCTKRRGGDGRISTVFWVP